MRPSRTCSKQLRGVAAPGFLLWSKPKVRTNLNTWRYLQLIGKPENPRVLSSSLNAAPKCEIEVVKPIADDGVPLLEIDPIGFEGLPALLSTEWQLQYPPCGSTHPSYPFPTSDPRLIFHEKLVPVTNGLPDCAGAAPLMLPLGWRHASWFGLLPIVFDPYQQAFKLTPIGPLPLTQEELSQNGLAKYVPGGELHPEADSLPDMVALSDGSEGRSIDWPGISWRLPWAEQGHFDESLSIIPFKVAAKDLTVAENPIKDNNTLWREKRDCPNQIIDLQDGWRWIADKEDVE